MFVCFCCFSFPLFYVTFFYLFHNFKRVVALTFNICLCCICVILLLSSTSCASCPFLPLLNPALASGCLLSLCLTWEDTFLAFFLPFDYLKTNSSSLSHPYTCSLSSLSHEITHFHPYLYVHMYTYISMYTYRRVFLYTYRREYVHIQTPVRRTPHTQTQTRTHVTTHKNGE